MVEGHCKASLQVFLYDLLKTGGSPPPRTYLVTVGWPSGGLASQCLARGDGPDVPLEGAGAYNLAGQAVRASLARGPKTDVRTKILTPRSKLISKTILACISGAQLG